MTRARRFIAFIFPLIFFKGLLPAQTAPVVGLRENPTHVFAFTHARIVMRPGQVITNGTLLCRDGLIEAVGPDVHLPEDATVFDLTGKTLYPGLIDLVSDIGMPDIHPKTSGSDRPGGAVSWNPAVMPERRATDLFRPDRKASEALRKIGFTTVMTLPQNGIFRGSGTVLLLNDKPLNEAILESEAAQIIAFSKGKGIDGEGTDAYPTSLQGGIALIRQTLYDAQWYDQAQTQYHDKPFGRKKPEENASLAALKSAISGRKPCIFLTSNELDALRAEKIAVEFNLMPWIMGCGAEYRRRDAIRRTGLNFILPLSFPETPDVSTREKEREITLRELRHWDAAPENPGRLARAGIPIALTSAGLRKDEDFLKNLRISVRRGLDADEALAALTVNPAAWLGLSHRMGSLQPGKLANFIVTNGLLFDDKTEILASWIAGTRFRIKRMPDMEVRGVWAIRIAGEDSLSLHISETMEAELKSGKKTIKVESFQFENRLMALSFAADSLGHAGLTRLTGLVKDRSVQGRGNWGDGAAFVWSANLEQSIEAKPDGAKTDSVRLAEFPVVYPDGAFGLPSPPDQPGILHIKNATLWTCGPQGILERGDLIVRSGKMAEVGPNLSTPPNALTIDATGKHVTPGIIDAHSHVAISGGGNEGSHAVVSEVRIKDVIDSDDINIYRQLAGGVTTSCVIHGSANPIAGAYAVIKLRWGGLPDDLILHDVREGLKFALGENVKQSNRQPKKPRYPQTRMGVMEIMRDSFHAALEYRQAWRLFTENGGKDISPRKILRYDPLLDVLDGKTAIHCHAYRQDEMLALMRLAEEMGFKVDVFIHALEAYKIAEELRAHDAMATVFSDWWTYKMEARDAIPHNGAMLAGQGIVVGFNSDDLELARRLNTEAAKAVKYGGLSEEEALKLVTINAAKHLFIDHRTGSLEPGKAADFAVWNGSPLSSYSQCEQTWIDGRRYFDLKTDQALRDQATRERNVLVQKALRGSDGKKGK